MALKIGSYNHPSGDSEPSKGDLAVTKRPNKQQTYSE
ncbi:JAB domain-containing protein [Shouchella miscanthi]